MIADAKAYTIQGNNIPNASSLTPVNLLRGGFFCYCQACGATVVTQGMPASASLNYFRTTGSNIPASTACRFLLR
jgi:hypothetical protein